MEGLRKDSGTTIEEVARQVEIPPTSSLSILTPTSGEIENVPAQHRCETHVTKALGPSGNTEADSRTSGMPQRYVPTRLLPLYIAHNNAAF